MSVTNGDGALGFASLRQLSEALRARRIGAVELLDHVLDRVAALNPRINAVVAMDVKAARRAARQADAALAAGRWTGPLHGVPMTIKDTFAVTGMPAAAGMPQLAGYRPPEDADAVALLRRAGAVIYGKTNVPFSASDHQSYNDVYGLTRNPWDGGRTAGGSSGGAAAALAAGLTPVELGSDIGGSIRVPAHCCGVFGHKASYGALSGRGHIPPMPGRLSRSELSVIGPMARSAHDLEILLDVLAQPDAVRAKAWSLRFPMARHEALRDFRVGLWTDAYPVDSRYRAAIEAFADDLRGLGVTVDAAARPAIDPLHLFEVYLATLMGILGSRMPEDAVDALRALRVGAEPASYEARIGSYLTQTSREMAVFAEAREHIFAAWRQFFRDCDVLICPVLMVPAFPHDTGGFGLGPQFTRRVLVDGQPRPYFDNLQWPGIATVSNLPATAMPTGRFVDGLPVGVQILGPYLEDRTPLRFAQVVEDALSPLSVPPGFADVA